MTEQPSSGARPAGAAHGDRRVGRWREGTEAALAAALPVLATLSLYLPSGVLSPMRLAIAGLVALAVWRCLEAPDLLGDRRRAVVLAAWAVLGCLGLLGLVRYPGLTGWEDWAQQLFILAACAAMLVLGRRRLVTWSLMGGWVAAGLLASGVGVWELVAHDHLSKHGPARRYGKWRGWNQIAAFFDNPNLYAYQLVVVIQVCLIVLFCTRRGWLRLLMAALLVLFTHQLWWTSGRTGVIVLLATAGLLLLRSRRGRIATVAVALAGLVAWLMGAPLARQVQAQVVHIWTGKDRVGDSTWVRLRMWRAGWRMAEQSGGLGVGPGGLSRRALLPDNPWPARGHTNAHFGMTEVLAATGFPGLLLVLGLLAAVVVVGWRTSRRLARQGEPTWGGPRTLAAMTATMAALLPMLSLANSTWLRQPLTAAHLATLVALAVTVSRRGHRGTGNLRMPED